MCVYYLAFDNPIGKMDLLFPKVPSSGTSSGISGIFQNSRLLRDPEGLMVIMMSFFSGGWLLKICIFCIYEISKEKGS